MTKNVTINSKPYDKGYKQLFQNKKNFLDFIQKYIALDWMMHLTEEDIEAVDKEFVSPEFDSFESDIIYKIRLDSEEIYPYILQEMQSKNDFTMPFRLLNYILNLWLEEFDNTAAEERVRKDYALPAIIPVVLYNGRNAWTAKQHFKEVIAKSELFNGYVVDFQYILVDLKRLEEDFILKSNTVIDNVFLLDKSKNMTEMEQHFKELHPRFQILTPNEQSQVASWIRNVASIYIGKQAAEQYINQYKKGSDGMKTGLEMIIDEEIENAWNAGWNEAWNEAKQETILVQKIFKLYIKGMSVEDISKECNLPEAEVKKILE